MLQHLLAHLFALLSYPASLAVRHWLVWAGRERWRLEHWLPWLQLAALTCATCDPPSSAVLWLTMHCLAGYLLVIQKQTTHHGPELYHAGDRPRQDTDWGLHMLDTTRDWDRSGGTWGPLARPLAFTTFGNHLLHHLFPAVDHSKVSA